MDHDGSASRPETIVDRRDPPQSSPSSVEGVALAISLDQLGRRLSSLEAAVANTKATDGRGGTLAELAKAALGGWPAFGLVFLVLFYSPLRDAIKAIPEKVKTADEITALGVSLKTSLKTEAERIGAVSLSQTLPSLSPAAVELLLRARPDSNSLVSYTMDRDMISTVHWPSEQAFGTLEELERQGLVKTWASIGSGDSPREGVPALRSEIAAFRRNYPGSEDLVARQGEVSWKLQRQQKLNAPILSWQLTDLGKKAVDVILRAVSIQLSPRPSTGPANGNR
jgi:hypothetical protein